MADPKYWRSEEVAEIARHHIDNYPEFDHLGHYDIRYLRTTKRAPSSAEGCKLIASMRKLPALVAAVAMPTSLQAQSPADVTAVPRPVYVMCVDDKWWGHADDDMRAALVHHELSHIDYEGRIAPHSFADHRATVRRFGAWDSALRTLADILGQERLLTEGEEAERMTDPYQEDDHGEE